ncbi:MAG: TonB-dependent receptor [Candidatus Omnitrophota bacterium]
MKQTIIVLLVVISIVSAARADDGEKESIVGKFIDGTLGPLSEIFAPYQRLDTIVVTPTRYEDRELDVPNTISIIDEKEIAGSHAKYVPDLLRSRAGISTADLLGNGKSNRIDMRGFGDTALPNVLVLVDGRRTNQIDLSGADWIQIDTDSIERIEVVRGPQSVLYGDNAAAGVINIITKKGAGKRPGAAFKYDAGSYRYSSYKGDIHGGSDFLDYFASAATSYNNGYRINNRLETVDYSGSVTMKPSEGVRLGLSSGYHKDWYGLPGAVKPSDINSIGRRGSIAPENSAKTEDYYMMATPDVTKDIGFGEIRFFGDILARSRRNNAIFYSSFGDVANIHHIKTFGLTPKFAFLATLFDIDNRVLAGLDYYSSRDEINSGVLSSMDSMIIDKDTAGVYVTDTLELPFSLIANAGFRSEWAYYKFNQEAVLTGKSEKRPFEYAYDAALTYKYNDRSSVYAHYSRSFRFPVTEEWYSSLYVDYFSGLIAGGLNLALKPQVAHTYEIGIKENSSKYLSISADYNIMDIKNEIYYDSVANQNAVHHHTIHHGLELESEFRIMNDLRCFFNYTYQKAFFVGEGFAGNEIPMVPRHKISTGLSYTYKDCVKATYAINYVGPRRFANDLQNNMPRLKEYTTHDVKLAYEKCGFEVYAAVHNLFDAEYSEYGALDFTLTRPGYFPSPRMNATAGVRYTF